MQQLLASKHRMIWNKPCKVLQLSMGPFSKSRNIIMKSLLSPEQVRLFENDGFLVLNQFSSREDVTELQNRMAHLIDEFDPSSISIFSTKNQVALSDKYFLESANSISFFFEEKAFGEDGVLKQSKSLSLNKVGHALHDLDPVFRQFSRSKSIAMLLHDLGYQQPMPIQSMYIFKQPKIGGEVVIHQDSTFLTTEPRLTCIGLWWAIEDADTSNGCLWVLPGSHRLGLLRRFMHKEGKLTFDRPAPEYSREGWLPVPVPAGSLVLLHGEVLHYSAENTSPASRHSYSMHCIEGGAGVTWRSDNWLQRKHDFPLEPLCIS